MRYHPKLNYSPQIVVMTNVPLKTLIKATKISEVISAMIAIEWKKIKFTRSIVTLDKNSVVACESSKVLHAFLW